MQTLDLGHESGHLVTRVGDEILVRDGRPGELDVIASRGSFTWTEGGTCTFTGTEVRYGVNGQWKTLSATGSTPCYAATFGGNPLPTVPKTCEYRCLLSQGARYD